MTALVLLVHPQDVAEDTLPMHRHLDTVLCPEAYQRDGAKLLISAINCNQFTHFQSLLARGISPNALGDFGQSALSESFKCRDTRWSEALLDAGGDPNAIENGGFHAWYWAVYRGHVGQVQMLLNCGVSIETQFLFQSTPLHVAVKEGRYQMAAYLLGQGANLEARDDRGRTPMGIAMEDRALGLIELLLDAGANPAPWLSNAVRRDDLEVAQLLCEAGARPSDSDLIRSVESSRPAMLDLLLQEGANPNARTPGGDRSALHLAAQQGQLAMVLRLLDAGADANIRRGDPEQNTTPLMEAACHGHPRVVDALLGRGARVNDSTGSGRSAFIFASVGKAIHTRGDQISAAKRLVEHGADVYQNVYPRNGWGETALSRAEGGHGDADMARYCRRVMNAEKRVRLTMWGTSVFQYQGARSQSSPVWGFIVDMLCFANRNMRGATELDVLPPELWFYLIDGLVSAHVETRNPRLSSWEVGVARKAIGWYKTDSRDATQLQLT